MSTYELNKIADRLEALEGAVNSVLTGLRQVLVHVSPETAVQPDPAQAPAQDTGPASQPAQAPTAADATAESAPEATSESAGNTETVGKTQIGAAKAS